jgi:peptidylprolyl isomerase
MRAATLITALLAAGICAAQSFDPKMPLGVPEVSGVLVQRAPLRYIVIREGTGAPAEPGQEYTVHYTGWLRDGTKFDSSVDRNQPFKFVQGRRQVITGWEIGFEGMKVGGRRRLFLPYQLAYGEKGRGKIPPKAELIFDVELLDVKDVPAANPGAELMLSFDPVEKQVLALARAVPEEKYAWRPGPGVGSFQEVFIHIANGNSLLLHLAAGTAPQELGAEIERNAKGEHEALSKEQVVAKLTESLAAVRKAIEEGTAGSLGRDVEFFGRRPTTVRGILVNIVGHISEHLGQSIAYARMNGIVPPWSQ